MWRYTQEVRFRLTFTGTIDEVEGVADLEIASSLWSEATSLNRELLSVERAVQAGDPTRVEGADAEGWAAIPAKERRDWFTGALAEPCELREGAILSS